MDLRKPKSMRCQTDVALSITRHLFSKQDNQDKNIIFSPFSIHAALSVMAAGSDGRTLNELLSYLRADSIDHLSTFFSQVFSSGAAAPSRCLSFANGMWADKSLSLSYSFKQPLATHYKATLGSVDFQNKADQVRGEVNSWVKKETNGLIKELLPRGALDKTTRLIFANALHFKGEWEHQFDAGCTFDYNFHLLNGTSVKVPFMTNKKDQSIRAFDGFKVLRLSYEQGTDKNLQFSMYIILPDAKDGLSALIEKMGSESGFLEGKFPEEKVQVGGFRIPKFNFSFAFEASNVLKELGVVSPFSQLDADFTKMVDNPVDGLYVESMFHKASIEVNEKGTEAGAASSLWGPTKCIKRGIEFIADHPFLFLIREDLTGTILFVGQVLHPNGVSARVKSYDFPFHFPSYRDLGLSKRKRLTEDDGGEDVFLIVKQGGQSKNKARRSKSK
ncbi:serpin-ZX-like [Lotus japonicus]|uniref:serpin-ZX-like n=1 Tax=Lotus japonicus TaxID=34305 RepID=UPI002587FB59|nr:serpin-ZX-like [Lotus japonicus]